LVAFVLIQLATWLTRVLPMRVQLGLCRAIAETGWRVLPAMHGRVRENVRHVLGPEASDDEVEHVARQQWRNYVRYMRDFAAIPHSARAEMERIFAAAEGWQYIVDAMSEGRGLVLTSVHFGNWDLSAGVVAQHYPVNVIADTFTSSKLDEAINKRRAILGLKVIPIEKAPRRTLSALRRGQVVAFLLDKPLPGDEGVEVELFGEPVRIPAGAAYFAARMGAPLILAFAWRDAGGAFRGKVLPPLQPAQDVQATMQRLADLVGEQIRGYPEHWYMFRRMWAAESATLPVGLEEAVA